jgi:hypothetical protein
VQIQQVIQITPGTSLGSLSSPTSTPEIDSGGPEPSNALSLCNSQSALDVCSDGANSVLLVPKTLSVIFSKVPLIFHISKWNSFTLTCAALIVFDLSGKGLESIQNYLLTLWPRGDYKNRFM